MATVTGNFVLSSLITNTTLWSSNTANLGTAPYTCSMLLDNDMAVIDSLNTTLWSLGTSGLGSYGGYCLVLDNGVFVVNDGHGSQLWSSF